MGFSTAETSGVGRWQGLEALLRCLWFPRALQVAFTFALAALVYLGLQPVHRAETSPALGIVWLLWWPVLPFTVPFLGRIWCALCPAGALGDWVQSIYPRDRAVAPGWVHRCGDWIAVAGIVVTGLAFLALALETNGPLTAAFLAVITGGAVVLALPYRGRVWCRWFCPLGLMLGLYSRTSWLMIGAGVGGAKLASGAARGCPQFTTPLSHRRRHDCILCGLCLKEGQAGAVALRFSWRPFQESREPSLTLLEALAVNILLGLLAVDSLRMTPLFLTYTTWAVPAAGDYRIALTLGGLGLMGVVLAGQAAFARRVGGSHERLTVFRDLSLALIPFVLAVHLALSAQHLFGGGVAAAQGAAIELGLLASGHIPPSDAYSVSLPLKALEFLLLGLGVGGMAYLLAKSESLATLRVRFPALAAPALPLGVIFSLPMSTAC